MVPDRSQRLKKAAVISHVWSMHHPAPTIYCSQARFVHMAAQGSDLPHTGGTKQRTFDCKLCGVAFENRKSLRSHLVIHSVHGRFVCMWPGCSHVSRNPITFRDHFRTHNAEPGLTSGRPSHTGSPSRLRYVFIPGSEPTKRPSEPVAAPVPPANNPGTIHCIARPIPLSVIIRSLRRHLRLPPIAVDRDRFSSTNPSVGCNDRCVLPPISTNHCQEEDGHLPPSLTPFLLQKPITADTTMARRDASR